MEKFGIEMEAQLKVSTKEAEKTLADFQKKIKSMRETGPDGGMSKLVQQYRTSGQDDRANRMEAFRQQANEKHRKELLGSLKEEEKQLDKLTKKHQAMQNLMNKDLVGGQRKVDLLKKQAQIYDQIISKSKQVADAQKMLSSDGKLGGMGAGLPGLGGFGNREIDHVIRSGQMTGSGRGGYLNGIKRAFSRNPIGMMGMVGGGLAGAVGAVGSAVGSYANFRTFQAGLPGQQAERQIGIAQNTNQYMRRGISGQSDEDLMFAPERAKAISETSDFFQTAADARNLRANTKAGIRGAGVLAATIGGAKFGAGVGTVVGGPGFGTAAGAVIGGVGAGATAAFNLFQDEEAYYGITGNKKALNQMTGKEAVEQFETFNMKNRLEDPRKYSQKKFLQENKGRILSTQRSAGLTDSEMYGEGGFLQKGANDFSFSDRAGMRDQIVDAGGSGRNSYMMALQAQRSLGLTNSGQAMGRLSSYMNQEESESAFIKILSKGVSIGLDDSKFVEEQKDYLNQVTAIANNLGGGTELAAAGIAAGMEDNMTRKGAQFAGEGFSGLMNQYSEREGVTAAARASLLSKDSAFDKIKGKSKLELQNMRFEDMEAGNEQLEMFFKMAGGTEGTGLKDSKSFAEKLRSISREALFSPYNDDEMKDWKKKIQDPKTSDEEKKQLETMMTSRMSFYAGDTAVYAKNKAKYDIHRKQEGFIGVGDESKVKDSLESDPTRMQDKLNQQNARIQNQAFQGMGDVVEEMSKTMIERFDMTLADKVKFEEFEKALAKGGEKAVQKLVDILNGIETEKKGGKTSATAKKPSAAKTAPNFTGNTWR